MTIATSAAGRAYLAALPADRTARSCWIRSGRRAARTGPTLEPRILAGLDDYARLGYCASFGEWHPHIHALGFSLRGPRGERYAVSCGGPAYLLPREIMLAHVAPRLLETVALINADIGTTPQGG